MKKFESLERFKLHSKEKMVLLGGLDNRTTTSSKPATTGLDQVVNPGCYDSEVGYDADNGTATGKCTTYTCPD